MLKGDQEQMDQNAGLASGKRGGGTLHGVVSQLFAAN